MLQDIERILLKQCGLEPGAALIAGVSGGPDSLCLMHALHTLGYHPMIAHFDHQLRPESAAEGRHVAAVASSLGLPFVAGGEDVRTYARRKRISIEEAGRDLRYAFLFAQARAHAAVAVAVGHTADDQAETVLMHLLRGTGMSGLSGMAFRVVLRGFDASIPIVRPLLGTWREQTLEYCRNNDLPAVNDPSNASREFLRNRVRLDLIPSLQSYNPLIRLALWRLSRSAADDFAILEDAVSGAWAAAVVNRGEGYVGFDTVGLAGQPPAIRRRLILRAALVLQPGAELDFEELQRAEAFITEPSSRRLQLGAGVMLFRESQITYVALGEGSLPMDHWPQMPGDHIAIGLVGSTRVPLAGGWHFTAALSAQAPEQHNTAPGEQAYRGALDADSLPPQLELRVPQPGDRIQTLGLEGHSQKLSDIFINIGVPERARSSWPVLAAADQIVWLPGLRIAEPFRIRNETRRTVIVAVQRPG
jgi:tRNA(Ile)-lysidine synthase